jgi:C1A family cysteine protease
MSDRKLTYKFQNKDTRDHTYNAEKHPTNNLEVIKINMSSKNNLIEKTTPLSGKLFSITNLPKILDQGSLGSCVANSFAFCISLQTNKTLNISRLYHYINSRILDFAPLNQDAGTTIRTACKAISRYGNVPESLCPYISINFSTFPSLTTYQSAKLFKTFSYTFVNQNLTSIKNCLNTYKVPIIFGFLVYSSFMTQQVASTGIVPMPNVKTERPLGGHCMNIIGYNDGTQQFTCVNSWGTSWGNKGFCYIPYTYLLTPTLASDFCFLQLTQ